MFAIAEDQRRQIEGLCRKYAVRRIRVFGSAVRPDFSQASSDLDFAVEFGPTPPGMDPATQYFALNDDLESLFGRPVDLVETRAIRNEAFRHAIETTAVTLYAA